MVENSEGKNIVDTNGSNDVLYEVNLVEELVSEKMDSVLSRFIVRDKTISRQKIIDLVVQKHEPKYFKGTKNEIINEITKFRTNTRIDVVREIIKVIININANVNLD